MTSQTTALERQILSQPDELERLATHAQVHDAVERLHRCHRLWLVGTGTSLHAAEFGAAMLHEAGRAAQAVPSMQFVRWAPPVYPQDGVIIISHNAGAETAYAKAARDLSLSAGLKVVSVTRQGGGLPEAVETVPQETSQTYTASYTGALVVLARIAGEMGAESFSRENLARVAPAVRQAIASPGTDRIPRPSRVLLLFGSGPASVTAREGALKVREASRSLAEGYDAEYLLHGSAVPLSGDDHLVALTIPDPDGLTAAVARVARAAGIPVTQVEELAQLPPILAQIPATVRLQLLALRLAVEREQDPDVVITGAWDDTDLWRIGAP